MQHRVEQARKRMKAAKNRKERYENKEPESIRERLEFAYKRIWSLDTENRSETFYEISVLAKAASLVTMLFLIVALASYEFGVIGFFSSLFIISMFAWLISESEMERLED